jgi:hypothetical protein
MSIANYKKPASQIFQRLEEVAEANDAGMQVLIVGPQYDVQEYSPDLPDGAGYSWPPAAGTTSYPLDLDAVRPTALLTKPARVYVRDGSWLDGNYSATTAAAGDGNLFYYEGDIGLRLYHDNSGTKEASTKFLASPLASELATFLTGATSVAVGDTLLIAGNSGFTNAVTRKVTKLIPSDAVQGRYDGVVLDGFPYPVSGAKPAETTLFIKIYKKVSGWADETVDPPAAPNNTAADGFTVPTEINVSGKALDDDVANLIYLEVPGLVVPAGDEGVVRSTSTSTADYGPDSTSNKLGQMVRASIIGGSVPYVVRTKGETVADYAEALEKAKFDDRYYYLVSVGDAAVLNKLFLEHVNLMSQPDNMRWRAAVLPIDIPDVWDVAGVGKISAGTTGNVAGQDVDFIALGLHAGDVITAGGQTATITEVLSKSALKVTGGTLPSAWSDYTVTKRYSAANAVSYLASVAGGDRRLVNVWSPKPQVEGKVVSSAVPAAEAAGIKSANPAHQPVTNFDIKAVDAVPASYAQFTEEQLDQIASYGILIVSQNSAQDPVVIRHQLTSAGSNLGPLFNEWSCVSTFDYIDYQNKPVVTAYVGRANVTQEFAQSIRLQLEATAISLMRTVDMLIGAPVLEFKDDTGRVGAARVLVHPEHRDKLVGYIQYQVPVPMNGIALYTRAYTWDGAIVNVGGTMEVL